MLKWLRWLAVGSLCVLLLIPPFRPVFTPLPSSSSSEKPSHEDVLSPDDGTLLNAAVNAGDRRVHIVAAGDNVIHPNITRQAARAAVDGGREYNYKPMYDTIAPVIAEADIAFINQETLMAGEEYGYSGYPHFNTPRDLACDLTELGFDVVNIANNHMADQGGDGLESTIEFWNSLPVTMIGGYLSQEDFDTPRIIRVNDVSVAFLSYTYSTNGISIAPSSRAVIPYLDEEDIRRQTAIAKEAADVLIISVHWGEENWYRLTEDQKHFAALMAECGADVILGHHPHVLQTIDTLARPDGGTTLCVYSLGNLISSMQNPYNMVGGLITFDIVRHEGRYTVENVLFLPTVFHIEMNMLTMRLLWLEDYSQALAERHGTATYGNPADYGEMLGIVKNNIPAVFLPEFYRQ